MKELINTLQDRIDRVKYYGEKIDAPDLLGELLKELDSIDESAMYNDEDLEAAYARGFSEAKEQVIGFVLQNASIKKRGDMIAAVRELESNG